MQIDHVGELCRFAKGERSTKPQGMPLTLHAGFILGQTVGLIIGVVEAVPGVPNIEQGFQIGFLKTRIDRQRRMNEIAEEQCEPEQVAEGAKNKKRDEFYVPPRLDRQGRALVPAQA